MKKDVTSFLSMIAQMRQMQYTLHRLKMDGDTVREEQHSAMH